ncbi:hypothetical protein B5M43_004010 [Microbacterium sp. MEC084]|uniref:HutD/Ves family protein n=1 Tax=Microbacterium sp. MEC084 TaxID=1963027 RepID=UPI0010704D8D|nr:HutD family protein [Microbacterium sp. MEC084]MCD1268015.1 hypothetical protein [Microbacterium sp. MEC084]
MGESGVVRLDDVEPEPWRNGRGTTRVLANGDGWRLSAAEIAEDAPFSAFPGLDRILAVTGDRPVRLSIGGAPGTVGPGAHVRFPGEAAVRAVGVIRPVTVLNLMLDRDRARCGFDLPAAAMTTAPDGLWLLLVLSCTARLGRTPLPPGSAVIGRDHCARVEPGGARVAFARISST